MDPKDLERLSKSLTTALETTSQSLDLMQTNIAQIRDLVTNAVEQLNAATGQQIQATKLLEELIASVDAQAQRLQTVAEANIRLYQLNNSGANPVA